MAYTRDWGSGAEAGSNWPYPNTGGWIFITTTPKTGTYCMTVSGGGSFPLNFRPFATPPAEAYFTIWLKIGGHVTAGNSALRVYISDGNYIDIGLNQATSHLFVSINGGAALATGTATFPRNTWFNVQARVSIGDSGVIQVKYEGQSPLDIDYSGDTKPGAGTTISYAQIVFVGEHNEDGGTWDDFDQGTGGWPGDIRYYPMPVASDADKNWLPIPTGTATNYSVIDEIPANDSDYIYTETNLQQNTCHIGTFDDTNKTVIGITHWVRAKKDPANAQTIKIIEDQGGTQNKSDAIVLTTVATDFNKASNVDPNGDSWTKALLESCHFGVEAQI